MKRLGLALIIFLGLANLATAQTKFTMPPPAGVFLGGYQVVTTCGTAAALVAGNLAFGAMDTTGAICTNASGGGGGGSVTQGTSPWVDNVTQWASGVLGAMANYGTSPGAVLVPGVNAYITGSSAGTVAGTTSTSALGSMVNCAATTSPSGQTTGNQSYLNCVAGALLGQLRVTPSYGVNDAVGDPCQTAAKTTVPFTLATAAVKVAITGVSAKKIYVCAWELNNNAADSIAIFEATTATVCVTAAAAIIGAGTSVATAATGYNFAANGGIARGNGASQVLATLTNAADLCIAQSAATQLSGSFTYVTQ